MRYAALEILDHAHVSAAAFPVVDPMTVATGRAAAAAIAIT